jgi:hypothetical protein
MDWFKGKNYRKTPYLMGKPMVSCNISLDPIHTHRPGSRPARYDSSHQTADDYTLMLEGVPAECTSERRLHRYIEKELNMEGRIYGVCSLTGFVEFLVMGWGKPGKEGVEQMKRSLENMSDFL